MHGRHAVLVGWRRLLALAFAALVMSSMNDAFALTHRDLIPVGIEFCMTATEDPERAVSFALAHDFVAGQRGHATIFSPSGDARSPFMGVTVYNHEGGGFAIECGFDAQAVGDISDEEIANLATRFGLEIRRSDETYFMTRQTGHVMVVAYLSVTNEWPCPGDGQVEVAPEALDSYRQVCGRAGLRLQLRSAYSPTVLPDR